MRRSHFLPIASAVLLVAMACSRSAAQGSAGYSASTNLPRRALAQVQTRTAAPTSDPTSASTSGGTPATHHKSLMDVARSKIDAGKTGKSGNPGMTFSPWSAAGALAVVVGLILVLARLFRRHAPMFQQSLPQEAVEILGRRFVDPRQTILLVRIGSRILVVGSSANGLNSLGEIEDPVEVDVLAGMCRRDPHDRGSRNVLLQNAQRRIAPAASAGRRSFVPHTFVAPSARSPIRSSPAVQQFSPPVSDCGRSPSVARAAGIAAGRTVAAGIRSHASAPRSACSSSCGNSGGRVVIDRRGGQALEIHCRGHALRGRGRVPWTRQRGPAIGRFRVP
jgi:flagellar biogenesis protein FliO